MKQTTNYNLNKPDPTDYIKVEDFNENADIIDTELKELHDEKASLASDFTAHQAESATQAHLAKNIGLEDTTGNFVATNVEGAMSELFTNVSNGKNLVGGAITGVDDSVVIPTDPTFGELADGIGQISTGKKWASGLAKKELGTKPFIRSMSRYTEQVSNINVTGLNFDKPPTYIIITGNHTYRGEEFNYSVIYNRNLPAEHRIATYYIEITSSGVITGMSYKEEASARIDKDGFLLPISNLSFLTSDVDWIAFE